MIRPAKKNEAEILTDISFKSKRYWNYPDEYFEIWKKELTVTSDYIEKNRVFVFEACDGVAGYYSAVELKKSVNISETSLEKGFWLEHMFIYPEYIGKGIGRKLFKHLVCWGYFSGIKRIGILSDPYARAFYEKMGCRYEKEIPSSIKKRTTPYMVFFTEDLKKLILED